jgi:hypothetical protein
MASLTRRFDVAASHHNEQAALRVEDYLSDAVLTVEGPSTRFMPGRRAVLVANVEVPPGRMSSGLAQQATLQTCLHAVGAARSQPSCHDSLVDLTQVSRSTFPVEIEVDQEGTIELQAEIKLQYEVDGAPKSQSGTALSPVGRARLTVAAHASAWIARLGSVLAAAGGVAGVALVINSGRGWLKRRLRKGVQAEAGDSSSEGPPE